MKIWNWVGRKWWEQVNTEIDKSWAAATILFPKRITLHTRSNILDRPRDA